MVTDSLRGLLLEASGYETQIFEFVSLEHTSKNKMILGVKTGDVSKQAALLAQIREIKEFYSIREHCLETLLVADGLIA
ncbi:MAG: methyltransferase, partial [Proteobacteria bacterium]|nr:methyltransferase [Pseudomonadota bacterium]